MDKGFEITAWIYGLVIISNSVFTKLRTDKKIRSKKMLSYFAKHNDVGMEFVKEGAVVPIGQINGYAYTVFVGDKDAHPYDKEWNVVKSLGKFNLSIGDDDSFWVAQLNELELWENGKLSGKDCLTEQVHYGMDELREVFRAVRIDKERGLYSVSIYGLKKKSPVEGELGEQSNYGFFFELEKVEALAETADPTTTDFAFYK